MVCRNHHSRRPGRFITFCPVAFISLFTLGKPLSRLAFPPATYFADMFKANSDRRYGDPALTKLATQWGHRYQQITDPGQVEKILAQNIEALFEDLNNPAYHDEIVSWFRFTDRAAQRHRDGLDWRCMNTSRMGFWLAAKMPNSCSFLSPDPSLEGNIAGNSVSCQRSVCWPVTSSRRRALSRPDVF